MSHPARSAGLISIADEANVVGVLQSSVLNLWEVVNNLTRLRPTKRDRYRATIFGSARSMLRPDCPLASPQDMAIPVCVNDGPAIVELVRAHHEAWRERQARLVPAGA